MLPIVQRELRVWARSPKLYKNRLRIGLVEVILACGVLLFSNVVPVRTGSPLFNMLAGLALLFCLLEGLRKTADAISEEKREGTLGFLFLTDLKGFDIILGKVAGAFIRSFNGLLAFFPILAITLLTGGVTLPEFWRATLALTNALVLSLSLGILISTFSRQRSMAAMVTLLGLLCFIPPLVSSVLRPISPAASSFFFALSPISLLWAAGDAYYSVNPKQFWWGLGIQQLISWASILTASIALPHVWEDKAKKAAKPVSMARAATAIALRKDLLDKNPFLWIAFSVRQNRSYKMLFWGTSGIFIVLKLFWSFPNFSFGPIDVAALFLLTLLTYLYLASRSSMPLAEAKQNGALELLLSTPLKVVDILQGQLLAIRRMFLIPVLFLLAWYFSPAIEGIIESFNVGISFVVLFIAVSFVLGCFAIIYTGFWMGLKSTGPNRAFFKTILLAIVLPYSTFILFCPFVTPIIQLVLLAIAKDRSKYNFRRFVAERYLQAPGFILARPTPAFPNSPPVIR